MTEKMLDDDLLQDYMEGFFGYGNYKGAYWFVGMEEGSGGGIGEISRRLTQWAIRGRNELEDVVEFHDAIGMTSLFGAKARVQPTWRGLIKVILNAEGRSTDPGSVLRFQQEQLGQRNSNNCLIELFPLPSRSTGQWLYADHSLLPTLKSRLVYMEHYAERRALAIRELIAVHKPKVVIFYSFNSWYRRWWQEIAGKPFTEDDGLLIGMGESTKYLIMKHPTAFGVSNAYLRKVGEQIS